VGLLGVTPRVEERRDIDQKDAGKPEEVEGLIGACKRRLPDGSDQILSATGKAYGGRRSQAPLGSAPAAALVRFVTQQCAAELLVTFVVPDPRERLVEGIPERNGR
jgi:hypothetical protein